MIKIIIILACLLLTPFANSKAIIDPDVQNNITLKQSHQLPVIVFLQSSKDISLFIGNLKSLKSDILFKKFDSLPAVLIALPAEQSILASIVNHPAVMQVSSLRPGHEELEFSEQAILLTPSTLYPEVSNWWDNGYKGKHQTIGMIDSGIAAEHSSLSQTEIIVRKEAGSGYDQFKNGVRTPHATGVACIYAGLGSPVFPNDVGIVSHASIILAALAGEGNNHFDDLARVLSSLDWMLSRARVKPDVINYSFGNGLANCSDCPEWSGLAKIVDYVVNRHGILWVKSAGNQGFIPSTAKAPYASTMTVPADNYNALTVANMNVVSLVNNALSLNPDRADHRIRYTSSRGPTLLGRKKPDISAPGNDTRTCAPDPSIYPFTYTEAMDYHDGFRLMGGTSSAAPHVGSAALLLKEAGISSPMAQKALLINSADAYTDSDKSGPDDPDNPYEGGHYPVMGSQWNRTYGWGYLNIQKLYDERNYIYQDNLTLNDPEKIYEADLLVGSKITLVHERRVGYSDAGQWKLSHLSLEIINKKNNQIIMQDDSLHDTVHQVANCQRAANEKVCSPQTEPIQALIKVKLLSSAIDGAAEEPFAIAASVPLFEKEFTL